MKRSCLLFIVDSRRRSRRKELIGPQCGRAYHYKDSRSISVRTLFGKVTVESPRFYHCSYQPHEQRTFSPVAAQLPDRTTPELLYLETKFASLLSYGISTDLLKDTLPVDEKLNPITLRYHLLRVSQRTEDALGEERSSLIDGCPRDWGQLPAPDGPLTVGIDGGYVRAPHKEGWFEVITGKSIPSFMRDETQKIPASKCFGFVRTFDTKPKRRLYELQSCSQIVDRVELDGSPKLVAIHKESNDSIVHENRLRKTNCFAC